MKNHLALLLAALFVLFASSCKKIASSVFKGQDITLPRISFTLPIVPVADSTTDFNAGSFTTNLDIDSLIKSHTSGLVGISVVETIKVKQVVVTAHSTDDVNNLSVLKSFRLTISSPSVSSPADMVAINIPASAIDTYTETPDNSANIVDYMQGKSFTNAVYGRIRKTTTKALKVDLSITLFAK